MNARRTSQEETHSASVVVIADDLTGAADTGVTFATQGAVTLIVLQENTYPPADVLVFSTESRHIPQDEAVARVDALARRLRSQGFAESSWFYKKIDSTLRGHPGAELAALMDGLGLSRALVAPAFPAQGRTTIDGRQYVHGTLLEATPFGQEVRTSDVWRLFPCDAWDADQVRVLLLRLVRGGITAILERLMRPDWRIMIIDAEIEDDLVCIVAAVLQVPDLRLLCGSAGLARAWARTRSFGEACKVECTGKKVQSTSARGVLVVAGSRHPQTLRQLEVAEAQDVPIIRPALDWFTGVDVALSPIVRQLASSLQERGIVILTTAGLPYVAQAAHSMAQRLAETVRALVDVAPPVGLVLTGGDVAFAVSAALEAEALWLRGEVQPGIPWGRYVGGLASGLAVVTKAGGFGDDNSLVEVVAFAARGWKSPR